MTLTETQQQKIEDHALQYAGYVNPMQVSRETAAHILTHLSEFLPEMPDIEIEENKYAVDLFGEWKDSAGQCRAYMMGAMKYAKLYEAMKQERDALALRLNEALIEFGRWLNDNAEAPASLPFDEWYYGVSRERKTTAQLLKIFKTSSNADQTAE